MDKVFLYKVVDLDDRDCVVYIENNPERFECGHYFGGITLHGSCFSGRDFADYEDIKTVLTKAEYQQLIEFNKAISSLGCGINKGDERYNKGIALCEAIQPIFDKLNSEENEELFEEVWQEEKEYLMEEHSLSEDEIEEILDNYTLDYKDRSIISCVFDDAYDCGYEEAYSTGLLDDRESWKEDILNTHFDFESFGEEIGKDDTHCTLPDGRIVCLSY